MAFDPKPSTHFGAGYTVSSNQVHLNTASAGSNVVLSTLTDAEADPTTGDVREVSRALVYKLAALWDAMAVADRPLKMTVSKSLGINNSTSNVTESYVFSFEVGTTLGNVAAE